MIKKDFTAEALLTRWEIRREVQNIMGKYSQSYCIKQEGALPRFWSKRSDVSLGINEGYYVARMRSGAITAPLRQKLPWPAA